MKDRVVITGYGVIGSIGSSHDSIWASINSNDQPGDSGKSSLGLIENTTHSPYFSHPLCDFDPREYIDKKINLRAMGKSQVYGAHAAGMALSQANLLDSHYLDQVSLILASTGGDGNDALDAKIYTSTENKDKATQQAIVNEALTKQKPTTFLTQLPNMFAYWVAHIFGVGGSSVTLMGEELAGMNAFERSFMAVRSGQKRIALVGGISDGLALYKVTQLALAGRLIDDQFRSVWDRRESGICPGAGAAFLVVESESSAKERGATIRAYVDDVNVTAINRQREDLCAHLGSMLDPLLSRDNQQALCSIGCGAGDLAQLEMEAYKASPASLIVRSLTNYTGAIFESAFLSGIAVSALCLEREKLFSPFARTDDFFERPYEEELNEIIVSCVGLFSGEGFAAVKRQ